MGLKSSHWFYLKLRKLGLRATYSVLQHFWSGHLVEHSEAMNEPQNTFKRPWEFKVSSTSSKFCQQVRSFVSVPPWRHVTFKFWEMLENASEVTLVPKNIFFLKILNFVQSFVEWKVSLADGNCRRSCFEVRVSVDPRWRRSIFLHTAIPRARVRIQSFFSIPLRLIGTSFTKISPHLVQSFPVVEEAVEGLVLHHSLK